MISQGSSEHSICCIVPAAQAARGRAAVEAAFAEAIDDGQVEGVAVTPGIAVLAAVGDGMVGQPGVSARLFAGLARARVGLAEIFEQPHAALGDVDQAKVLQPFGPGAQHRHPAARDDRRGCHHRHGPSRRDL